MKKTNEITSISQVYETPEIVTIKIQLEAHIAASNCPSEVCSSDIENLCSAECEVD